LTTFLPSWTSVIGTIDASSNVAVTNLLSRSTESQIARLGVTYAPMRLRTMSPFARTFSYIGYGSRSGGEAMTPAYGSPRSA
jgi:hypothetical protein